MLLRHLALALANLFTISVARPTWSWDVVPSCERLSRNLTAALLLLQSSTDCRLAGCCCLAAAAAADWLPLTACC